jgi:hypothetical protein
VLPPLPAEAHLQTETCKWQQERQAPRIKEIQKEKGVVVSVVHSRGHCKSLRPIFLPLQIACSFTCSVASLGQSPHHYLPGLHSLRHGALADYLLGQGRPSTCPTGLTEVPDTTSPHSHMGDRRMRPLPDGEILYLSWFFGSSNEVLMRPANPNTSTPAG